MASPPPSLPTRRPKLREMVVWAMESLLSERSGRSAERPVSRKDISDAILDAYEGYECDLPRNHNAMLSHALTLLTNQGVLLRCGGCSYKLVSSPSSSVGAAANAPATNAASPAAAAANAPATNAASAAAANAPATNAASAAAAAANTPATNAASAAANTPATNAASSSPAAANVPATDIAASSRAAANALLTAAPAAAASPTAANGSGLPPEKVVPRSLMRKLQKSREATAKAATAAAPAAGISPEPENATPMNIRKLRGKRPKEEPY